MSVFSENEVRETKKITIEHTLTDDEINAIARKNAQRDRALQKVQEHLKRVQKHIKRKMKKIDERRMKFSNNILSGKMDVDVDTYVEKDFARRRITYYDKVTFEILKTENMPAHMQEELY